MDLVKIKTLGCEALEFLIDDLVPRAWESLTLDDGEANREDARGDDIDDSLSLDILDVSSSSLLESEPEELVASLLSDFVELREDSEDPLASTSLSPSSIPLIPVCASSPDTCCVKMWLFKSSIKYSGLFSLSLNAMADSFNEVGIWYPPSPLIRAGSSVVTVVVAFSMTIIRGLVSSRARSWDISLVIVADSMIFVTLRIGTSIFICRRSWSILSVADCDLSAGSTTSSHSW